MTTLAKRESGYLSWLNAALTDQRGLVLSLVRRLAVFGPQSAMKGSIFAKFMHALEQISLEKQREDDIISRIEDIEHRHRYERRCHRLKTAEPSHDHSVRLPIEDVEPERDGAGEDWLLLAAVVGLLNRTRPKPQD